jgi:tetratricopeptide (TPR) repeat protein
VDAAVASHAVTSVIDRVIGLLTDATTSPDVVRAVGHLIEAAPALEVGSRQMAALTADAPDLAELALLVDTARRNRGRPETAETLYQSGLVRFRAGQDDAVEEFVARALELVPAVDARSKLHRANVLNLRAIVATDPDSAAELAGEAVRLAIEAWDNSEYSQGTAAQACKTLGVLAGRIGHDEYARHWLTEAVRIFRSLAAWRPSKYVDEYLRAEMNLVTHLGGDRAAKRLAELEHEAERAPTSPQRGATIALLQLNQAIFLLSSDPERAHERAIGAVDRLRTLADIAPGRFLSDLSEALGVLSHVLAARARPEAAALAAVEAADLSALPGRARRGHRAIAYATSAAVKLHKTGDRDRAADYARRAIATWKQTDRQADVHVARSYLIASLVGSAGSRSDIDDARAAVVHYSDLADRDPETARMAVIARASLAIAEIDAGLLDDARRTAREAVRLRSLVDPDHADRSLDCCEVVLATTG